MLHGDQRRSIDCWRQRSGNFICTHVGSGRDELSRTVRSARSFGCVAATPGARITVVGATSGGLISAILLKIPGTPSSIATTFDGGPMMEKGEGAKALGVGIVFSFLGTIASIAALAFIAPSLASVALSFGPHEYFAIAVFSLTLIATLSSGSMAKGIFAGVLGFAVSTVGIAPVDATTRFTFGNVQLNAGFSILTVLVGMFAVAEVIKVAESARHLGPCPEPTQGRPSARSTGAVKMGIRAVQ